MSGQSSFFVFWFFLQLECNAGMCAALAGLLLAAKKHGALLCCSEGFLGEGADPSVKSEFFMVRNPCAGPPCS